MILTHSITFPQRSRSSFAFLLDQEIDTVESHTAVVADDSSTAVSVRKTGYDVAVAGSLHLWCVGIKNSLVVSFVVFSEDLVELLIYLISVSFGSFLSHLDSAESHECTF